MTQNPTKNTEFEQTVLTGLREIYKQLIVNNQLLERIALGLEKSADTLMEKSGPRYMGTVNEFKDFDWGSIGATILRRDRDNLPDLVKWKDQIYTRRAKTDQDSNVWFSRHLSEGQYDVLIRFIDPPKSKRLDID